MNKSAWSESDVSVLCEPSFGKLLRMTGLRFHLLQVQIAASYKKDSSDTESKKEEQAAQGFSDQTEEAYVSNKVSAIIFKCCKKPSKNSFIRI